ncbi:hypothetical protein KDX23_12700 [Burkholderia vietnamiensis]|uniref:hypothetical protein n=1 Tax=Burkholderia vietnamiensis TaxID=60552 RepID=UPI001B954CFF|nr:hypothetical protein [Burkholderia vietnamiensis]MBR8083599.1 hypothetical protein [Burkholderia vietnamiensis]
MQKKQPSLAIRHESGSASDYKQTGRWIYVRASPNSLGNAALRKLQERNHAATARFIERKFTKYLENRAVDLQRVIKSDKLQYPGEPRAAASRRRGGVRVGRRPV